MLALYCSMASSIARITCTGFWVVAALSRYTNGLPYIFCSRIGKSFRILLISIVIFILQRKGTKCLESSTRHLIALGTVQANLRFNLKCSDNHFYLLHFMFTMGPVSML